MGFNDAYCFKYSNRFHQDNGFYSDEDILPINLLARALVERRLGEGIYNDPRSGHMSFSPDLSVELVNRRKEIHSTGYGIYAELSCSVYEFGYPIYQTDVWFRRQRERYTRGMIPSEDLQEYIDFFGIDIVRSALSELNFLLDQFQK